MEAIRAEGLSKNFGGFQALKEVSFSMEVGERLAVIGPNGAGKTTLFKVLSGDLRPLAGRVYLLGQDVTSLPTHRRIHLGLARTFQLTTLFLDLTVLTNTLLAVQGTIPSRFQMFRSITAYGDTYIKAHKLLQAVNLSERKDELVKNIGHGEQRRLEIALGLGSDPRLLLMDEPSAGLTLEESNAVANMIRNQIGEDTSVLISAHDMDLVFGVADRIMVLYFGQIIAQGTPKEIQADPRVKEIYLGV